MHDSIYMSLTPICYACSSNSILVVALNNITRWYAKYDVIDFKIFTPKYHLNIKNDYFQYHLVSRDTLLNKLQKLFNASLQCVNFIPCKWASFSNKSHRKEFTRTGQFRTSFISHEKTSMHTDSTKTEGNSHLKERNVYSSSVVRTAELTTTEGNVDCDRWSLVCDRSLRDSVAWCYSGVACLLKQPISFIDEGRSNSCGLRVQRFFFFFVLYLS